MNTIVPLSHGDDRLEVASRWVLKLEEGLSDSDQDDLKIWLAGHPDNVAEFLDVARVCDKIDDLSRLADLFPHEQVCPAFWMRRTYLAAMASIVVLVAVAFLFFPAFKSNDPKGDSVQFYETAVGEQSTVTLPDGTVVVLNTNSRLSVAYSANARILRLHRGEIHVEVAKDSTRLLSVLAGNRIVQAVGTSFGVEITQDHRIDLVVTEGKVVVGIGTPVQQQSASQQAHIPRLLAQSAKYTVTAGEELVLGAQDEEITSVSAEEIEVRLSWRKGSLIFRGESLEDALAEVERYTTVEFVFLDEELQSKSVSGRYKVGDVEALLIALRTNFNIAHEYVGEDRVLLSRL